MCRARDRPPGVGGVGVGTICLSVRPSVHPSIATHTVPPPPVLLTQTARTLGSDWPWEASGGPRLLFGQLIDLLTLSTGRVSLNLISEFISGETCVQK